VRDVTVFTGFDRIRIINLPSLAPSRPDSVTQSDDTPSSQGISGEITRSLTEVMEKDKRET
jgi:hypothetical protein